MVSDTSLQYLIHTLFILIGTYIYTKQRYSHITVLKWWPFKYLILNIIGTAVYTT